MRSPLLDFQLQALFLPLLGRIFKNCHLNHMGIGMTSLHDALSNFAVENPSRCEGTAQLGGKKFAPLSV